MKKGNKKKKKHIVLKVLLSILIISIVYVSGSFLFSIIARNAINLETIKKSLIVLKDNFGFANENDINNVNCSNNVQNNFVRLDSNYYLLDEESEETDTEDEYETPFTLKSEKILKKSLSYKSDDKELRGITDLYFLVEEAQINSYSVYPLIASVDYFINTDEYQINKWYKTSDEVRKEYYNINDGDVLNEYTYDLYFKIFAENKYIYLCYLEKYDQGSEYVVFKFKADEETNSLIVEIAEGVIYLGTLFNVTSYLEFISIDGKITSFSYGKNHDQSDLIGNLEYYDYLFYNVETNMHAGAYYEKVIIDDKTYFSYNESGCTDKFDYYAYVTSKYSLVNLNKIFMGTSSYIDSYMPIIVSEFGYAYKDFCSNSFYYESEKANGGDVSHYVEEYIYTTKGFKELLDSIDYSQIPDSVYKTYLLNNKEELIQKVEDYNNEINQSFSSVLNFDKSAYEYLVNQRNDFVNLACGNIYYCTSETSLRKLFSTEDFTKFINDLDLSLINNNDARTYINEHKDEMIATVKDYNDRMNLMISSNDFDIELYAELILERNNYICSNVLNYYPLEGNYRNILFSYSNDENFKNAYLDEYNGIINNSNYWENICTLAGEKIEKEDLFDLFEEKQKTIICGSGTDALSYYDLVINLPAYIDRAINDGVNLDSIYSLGRYNKSFAFLISDRYYTNEEVSNLEKIFNILLEKNNKQGD